MKKVRDAIDDLLKSKIREELTYCNEKIIKAKYQFANGSGDVLDARECTIILGGCFFWNQKTNETNKYEPWVN